jgi:hypothetical protein
VEAVAEGMRDHFVGHHPAMPGTGKTAQTNFRASRFIDGLHGPMMI